MVMPLNLAMNRIKKKASILKEVLKNINLLSAYGI